VADERGSEKLSTYLQIIWATYLSRQFSEVGRVRPPDDWK